MTPFDMVFANQRTLAAKLDQLENALRQLNAEVEGLKSMLAARGVPTMTGEEVVEASKAVAFYGAPDEAFVGGDSEE